MVSKDALPNTIARAPGQERGRSPQKYPPTQLERMPPASADKIPNYKECVESSFFFSGFDLLGGEWYSLPVSL